MKTANKKSYIFVAAFIVIVFTLIVRNRTVDKPILEQSDLGSGASNLALPPPSNDPTAALQKPAASPATAPGTATENDPAKPAPETTRTHASSEAVAPSSPGVSKPMQPFEFDHLAQQALETLPKGSDVKAVKTGETHHLSPEIIARVQVLADIVEAVSNNPQFETRAIAFYQNCAQKDDLMVAVRARCLAHLKTLADRHSQAVDLDKYPADVKRLANYIQ